MMPMSSHKPRIVILGAGFAGLSAAKSLAHCNADIVLIDRHNHHAFQPLLYQVATAALSPAQIAQPIRSIMKKQKNCTVTQGEIIRIDKENKIVYGHKGSLQYDYLIVATGATHTYFGHDEWAPFAPGLKSIADALRIRSRILHAFEQAEITSDPDERAALMTFVVIGAGPTGVEMAGSIAELARHTLKDEFRIIDPSAAKILLIEAGPRILANFPEPLSHKAKTDLEHIGVTVLTSHSVTECSQNGIRIGDKIIPSHTVIWSAGVKASPAHSWLNVQGDKAGRVIVNSDLSLEGHPEIYVVGDTAHVIDRTGIMVPGLAPAAEQQGRYAAESLMRKIENKEPMQPFAYHDYGTMATIGRNKAIAKIKGFSFSGFIAWILWGSIHIMPLVGFRNRLAVAIDWTVSYFTRSRGVRLITEPSKDQLII